MSNGETRALDLPAAIGRRYPNQGEHGATLRTALEGAYRTFLDAGLGDRDALQKLCSPQDAVYWQQLSEVLLADQLQKHSLAAIHPRTGPDLLVDQDGTRIWIEIVTPEPTNIPEAWLAPGLGVVRAFPHEALLLRWTAAIAAKASVLLGNEERPGYLGNGVVGAADAYVVAVNGRLLRSADGVFPELNGISQFPFAVEATFGVGPMQVHIDRETLKAVGSDHQERFHIPKPNGASVSAYTFLDPAFAAVSAIWAVDVDESVLLGRVQPMAVVHNPLATNPIPTGLLPAQVEYRAVDKGDHFQLGHLDGRLAEVRQA
ncbi:type I restriction enzyme S subunit [Aminobacter lissarensis]|uniref:Type I restriction enzyme S subunit n=1 Tax=Aminobacter carboxidus TaxID=376165 RepID=A0A8E2BE80_9HYPH|nr:hypothetical protein [Aminobacter lissarensis]MBB6469476.1 type I restriction enzyme S subunit [Aminobacter lissarensis]